MLRGERVKFDFNSSQPHKPWQDKLNETRFQEPKETRIKKPNPVQKPKSLPDIAAGKYNYGPLSKESSSITPVKHHTTPIIITSSSITPVRSYTAPTIIYSSSSTTVKHHTAPTIIYSSAKDTQSKSTTETRKMSFSSSAELFKRLADTSTDNAAFKKIVAFARQDFIKNPRKYSEHLTTLKQTSKDITTAWEALAKSWDTTELKQRSGGLTYEKITSLYAKALQAAEQYSQVPINIHMRQKHHLKILCKIQLNCQKFKKDWNN